MIVQDETMIQESSINQKSNNTIPVMDFTGATFVKKDSFLVARTVSIDTAGVHLPILMFN